MRRLCGAAMLLGLLGCSEDPAGEAASDQGAGAGTPVGQGVGAGTGTGGNSGGGGSGSGASGPGGGGAAPTGVGMFVAQGHFARTTISCDSGQSWVAEQSEDPMARCWGMNGPDCDHASHSARGIAFGDGWFMATFGWGAPGSIRRSRNGVDWEMLTSDTSFAGVAYGNGVFMVGAFAPHRSMDDGVTWEELEYVVNDNVRRTAFVDAGGGMFIMASDGPLLTTVDAGTTWLMPPVPAGCGHNIMFSGGIAHGNGAIVVLSGNGFTCVSTDDGATFVAGGNVGVDISSDLIWSGSEFMAWSDGNLHTSSDGTSWTATPYAPSSLRIGPTARSDDGSIVAVRGGWQVWYEDQAWYRSADGITWDTLPAGNVVGGHPVFDIAFGRGESSAACP